MRPPKLEKCLFQSKNIILSYCQVVAKLKFLLVFQFPITNSQIYDTFYVTCNSTNADTKWDWWPFKSL